MAERSYDNKLLKGQELVEYTKKLKQYIESKSAEITADAEQYTDDAFNHFIEDTYRPDLVDIHDDIVAEADARDAADTILQQNIDSLSDSVTTVVDGITTSIYNLEESLNQKIDDVVTSKIEIMVCARGVYQPDGQLIELYEHEDDEDPVQGAKNYLYMVPAPDTDPTTNTDQINWMNEYVWNDNHYELVGSTDIRLDKLNNNDIDAIWAEVFSPLQEGNELQPEPGIDDGNDNH